MEKRNSLFPAYFSFAFFWFTVQFGGGFASGRQIVEYFIRYGWYAVFTPILAQILIAVVLYFAAKYAMDHKVYNYRKWSDSFYGSTSVVMSTVFEIMFNVGMVTATAVAFSTGGATITTLINTPYTINTFIIAIVIFLLTSYGAELVRKAATVVSITIIAGVLIVSIPNIIALAPDIARNYHEMTVNPAGTFGAAMWRTWVYGCAMISTLGAYLPHTVVFKDKSEIKKSLVLGVILCGGIIMLFAVSMFGVYDMDIVNESVPMLTLVQNGFGSAFMTPIIFILIVLGAVSTGVNLSFGTISRLTDFWARNDSEEDAKKKFRKRSQIASIIVVGFTWCIAQFGLIPLVAKGYGMLGWLAMFIAVIPLIARGIIGWRRPREEKASTAAKASV